MKIEFIDKNARQVSIMVGSAEEADIVMELLYLVPNMQFIRLPQLSSY